MKLRIGECNGKYWIEGRMFLRWARLPPTALVNYERAVWRSYPVKYYDDYKDAREAISVWQVVHSKERAVYVNI